MRDDIPWCRDWKTTIRMFKATDVDRLEVVALVERAMVDEATRPHPDVDHAFDIATASTDLPREAIEYIIKRFLEDSEENPWAWAMASWFLHTFWNDHNFTSVDRDLIDGLIATLDRPPSGDDHLDFDTTIGVVSALNAALPAIADDSIWRLIIERVRELLARGTDAPEWFRQCCEHIREEYEDMRERAATRGLSLD